MHCAIHVKIKLRADIKGAAAQSCILPDFSFCLALKSTPKAMGFLRRMSFFGNPSLLPIYQILSTLLKYFMAWLMGWALGTESLGTHKASVPIRQPTQELTQQRNC